MINLYVKKISMLMNADSKYSIIAAKYTKKI